VSDHAFDTILSEFEQYKAMKQQVRSKFFASLQKDRMLRLVEAVSLVPQVEPMLKNNKKIPSTKIKPNSKKNSPPLSPVRIDI